MSINNLTQTFDTSNKSNSLTTFEFDNVDAEINVSFSEKRDNNNKILLTKGVIAAPRNLQTANLINIKKRLACSLDTSLGEHVYIRADFSLQWCNNLLIEENEGKGNKVTGVTENTGVIKSPTKRGPGGLVSRSPEKKTPVKEEEVKKSPKKSKAKSSNKKAANNEGNANTEEQAVVKMPISN